MNKNNSSFDFLMKIQDTATIKGRGTVATGFILFGKINLGDIVHVVGNHSLTFKIDGIERGGDLWEKALSGDSVGLLIKSGDPKIGDILYIKSNRAVEGNFAMITEAIYEMKDSNSYLVRGKTLLPGEISYEDRLTFNALGHENSARVIYIEESKSNSYYYSEGDAVGVVVDNLEGSKLLIGQTLSVQKKVVQEPTIANQGRANRIALVIGNNSYPKMPLRNCVGDAEAFADRLASNGFDVIKICDANKAYMDEAVRQFCKEASKYEAALLLFTGHGMQHDGQTYLLPTDFPCSDTLDKSACCLDEIIRYLDITNCPIKVIILDSCRSSGRDVNASRLSNIKASEIFVAYSTGPGQIASDGLGNHSPFMEAMLSTMDEKKVPIYEFFKRVTKKVAAMTGGSQTPWTEDCLTNTNFCL